MSSKKLEEKIAQVVASGSDTLELTAMRLTDDDLTALPPFSGSLVHIKRLILFGNDWLTDVGIVAITERLPGLTHLDLRGCDEVTDSGVRAIAEHLAGLTFLDLNGCGEVTDAGVRAIAEHLAGLTFLDLSWCRLVTDVGVRAITEHLTGLAYLGLARCEWVTDAGVRALAERLAGLTNLSLGGHGVTNEGVKCIAERLHELEDLGLSGCSSLTNTGFNIITSNMIRLTCLDLSGCQQIGIIPETIDQLQNLQVLILSAIPGLASLPRAIRSLRQLRSLRLDGNRALGLPTELIDSTSDPRRIFDYYFRATTEGKKQLNEAKLLIVGNEAAGKSSLVDFLIKDTPASQKQKTPGVAIQERINVSKWDTGESDEGDPLRLNVWDFGGQEVMYKTHRFFLTARSLYLLVLDARRENARDADETVHEWMRTIRAKAGDAPVIVVVNKADHGPYPLLDERRLQVEYPNLVEFVRTSCLDPATCPDGGKGIQELRRLIVRTVREKLDHVRDWLPASYFRVKESLGQLARDESVLNASIYARQCRENTIEDPSEQANLLDLLDKIGVVVKYDDSTLLDPNWLTTAVYRLLTHAEVTKADGELTRDDLGHLLQGLPPEKYPLDRWAFIIEMMCRFHLCFKLQDQPGRYLIPEQLNPNEPYLTWDEAASLRFRFGYDQLPHGLIPRFIVETHDKLPKQRCAWVNGVILEIDQCRVLVRSDWKNRRVDVFVEGPPARCRGALAVVRDRFARVHKLYPELNPRELVPLPDRPDLEVNYLDLVKLEELGQAEFLPPGAGRLYRVGDLLNKVEDQRRRPTPPGRDRRDPDFPRPDDLDDEGPPDRPTFPIVEPIGIQPEPPSPAPVETSPRWWLPLVGPGVAAISAGIVAALLRWDYQHPVTVVVLAAVSVFAGSFLAQARYTSRMEHWAKYVMFLFAGCFVPLAFASLTGIKLIAKGELPRGTQKTSNYLELLLENSPLLAGLALVGAMGFGLIQLSIDRSAKAR